MQVFMIIKKTIITAILVVIFLSGLQASQDEYHWTLAIQEKIDIKSMVTDSAFNLYIAGNSLSSGDSDIVIGKYDFSGNEIWQKKIGGVYDDVAFSIAINTFDELIVGGFFGGNASIDTNDDIVISTNEPEDQIKYNGFIMKTDPANGKCIWLKTIKQTIVSSVCFDSNNDIFYSGAFQSGSDDVCDANPFHWFCGKRQLYTPYIDFNPSEGDDLQQSKNAYPQLNADEQTAGTHFLPDIFLSHLSRDGEYQGTKTYGAENKAFIPLSMDIKNDFVYIAGAFMDALTQTNQSFLMKTTNNCNEDFSTNPFLWVADNQLHSTTVDLMIDTQANVYLAGIENFANTISELYYGNITFPEIRSNTDGVLTGVITKIDQSGQAVRFYACSADVRISFLSVHAAPDNSIYVTGFFTGSADFDQSDILSTGNVSSSGDDDIFLLKLDANGNFLWVKQMGAYSGLAHGQRLLMKGNSMWMSGIFASGFDFAQPFSTSDYQTCTGESCAYVLKLNDNHPPAFTSPLPLAITIVEDQTHQLEILTQDTDSDNITHSFYSLNDSILPDSHLNFINNTLFIEPLEDLFGMTGLSIILDDGSVKIEKQINIFVLSANDCPTFNVEDTYIINEDDPLQVMNGWAYNILAGPSNESSQQLNFSTTATHSDIFAREPEINGNGNLIFEVKNNEHGISVVSIQLIDDGGTDNGGCNSTEKSFTITVNPVNDPPINTDLPEITGIYQINQSLYFEKGSWNDSMDKNPGTLSYAYHWDMADTIQGTHLTRIPNETSSSLQLTESLENKFIRGTLTVIDDGEGLPVTQCVTWQSAFVGPVKPLPIISFASLDQRVQEKTDQIEILIILGRSSNVDVSLPYTLAGTASSGTDYSLASPQPLFITKGHTSASILIDLMDDIIEENEETIIVSFGTPDNAEADNITMHTITIKANDRIPEITSISPSQAYIDGGIHVSILGNNFVSGANVQFGDMAATCHVQSNNQISCIAPAYDNGLTNQIDVTVTVTNPGGQSDNTIFTYFETKTIAGRVTANTVGISNCLVEVSAGNKIFRTASNTSGYYTINHLESNDNYLVSAWPDKSVACYSSQYYNGKEFDTADPVSTMSGSRFNIDFSLVPCANGQISGTVKDGNSLTITSSELLVMAFSMSLNESGFAVPEPDGSYLIKGLHNASDYEVSVVWTQKPEITYYYAIPSGETVGQYLPASSAIMLQNATPILINNNHVSNINLIVDTDQSGSISGVVYDCEGNPVSQILVFAQSSGLNIQRDTLTDRNGHFEITDLPVVNDGDRSSNGYIVSAKKLNYPTRYYGDTNSPDNAFRVITGENNIEITEIGCGNIISGLIKDELGQPVSMVPIIARSVSNNSDTASGIVYSDSNGAYSITSLMPLTDYIVFAVPINYEEQYYNNATSPITAKRVDISTGNVSGINFILTEGPKLCGNITINGGAANEGTPVNIWSESTQTGGTTMTDTNHFYEIHGLNANANDYVVSVILPDYLPSFYHSAGTKYRWSEAEKISPASTCNTNINVVDGFMLSGRILYDNTPVYNVDIEAYSDDGGWGFGTSRRIIGSTDNYRIKGLAPGNYEVTAEVKQECYSAIPQTIWIDNQDVSLDIELSNICASIMGTIHNLNVDQTVYIAAFSQSTLNYQKVSVTGPNNVYCLTNLKPASDYIIMLSSPDYPKQYYNNQTNWSDANYVNTMTGNQSGIDFTLIDTQTISGNLTFTNGQTGDQATVMASSNSLNIMEYVTITYPETHYTLTVRPANDYVVNVSSLKYKVIPSEQLADATSDITNINFTLNDGAEISGHVYDENNNSVSGISVEAWSESKQIWSFAVTDKTGQYTITGLTKLDDYIVSVDHPVKSVFYYSPQGTVKDASQAGYVSLISDNAQQIDIHFFSVHRICGKVVDEKGKALSSVWVHAWSDMEQAGNGARTDSDGLFAIPGLVPSIDYEVEAIPNPATSYRSAIQKNIISDTTDLTFILIQGYTLSGEVINKDGDPVSQVVVEVRSLSKDKYGRIKSDNQGVYEIRGIVSASDYKLMATASGNDSYIPVSEDIAIVEDTTKLIELTPAFTLSGYVKKDGTGIKDVQMTLISRENDDFVAKETTDSRGFYLFKNVPAGSDYEVIAQPENFAQQTRVDQTAGTRVDFDLFSGGPISGYVRDSSFNPLSGAKVKLESSYLNTPKGTVTDSNGYYVFNGLQKYDLSGNLIADYQLTVSSVDYPRQIEKNIKVGDTIDFTLTSSDNNILSGLVTDQTGEIPPSTKYVYVFLLAPGSNKMIQKIKTDENGRYEFKGLQVDQEYQLIFRIMKGVYIYRYRFAGIDGPTSNRTNAHNFLPGNAVNFQFDISWE